MRLRDTVKVFFLVAVTALCAEAAEARGPSKALADYFPADTLVYFEVPDIPALTERMKGTGLYALWQDDQMAKIREFVNELPQLAPGPKENWGVFHIITDFAGLVSGGAAAGLVPGPDGMGFLLVVKVGQNTSAAKEFLDDIYAKTAAGAPPKTVEVAGVEAAVTGAAGIYSCVADDLLVAGTKYAFTGALDRRLSAANVGSLSGSVNFTNAASFFSKGPSAYRMVVDLPALRKKLDRAVGDVKFPFDVQRILEGLGINDIDTVSMEGVFRLGGLVDHLYISTKSADSKFIDMIGRASFEEARPVAVPRGALFFGARTSDTKASYTFSLEMLKIMDAAGKMDFAGMLENLEKGAGVSVEKDVLPALGTMSVGYFKLADNFTIAMLGPGAPPVVPFEQVTLVEVTDKAALSMALEKIAAYAQANPAGLFPSLPSGAPPLKVETTTLGKMKIYSVTAPGAQFVSPSVTISDGYLVYANSKDAVISAVDRLIAPAASILENPDYTRARSALSRSACQLAYVSLDGVIDFLYDNLLQMAAPRIDAMHRDGKISFSSADIPSAFVVKKHIDGCVMAVVTSGNLVDIEVYSPLGVGMPLVGLISASSVLEKSSAVPFAGKIPGAKVSSDPARERLLEIGSLLQLATVERHGSFPEKLADVVPAGKLQAPQDPAPDSPVDYEYVTGLRVTSPNGIIVYERKGLQGDGRHVLYVDGSVAFLTEDEFQRAMGPQE